MHKFMYHCAINKWTIYVLMGQCIYTQKNTSCSMLKTNILMFFVFFLNVTFVFFF